MCNDADDPNMPLSSRYREKTSPVWDMSQERVFIEQLLNHRFNFFLILFSVTIAGAVNVKSQGALVAILAVSLLIEFLLMLVLARSQHKLDLILLQFESDSFHPVTVINRLAKGDSKTKSRRHIVGLLIPRLCCVLLLVGFLAAATNQWTVTDAFSSGQTIPKQSPSP
ncbi:MAG: hypothetical protein H7232_00585 [Aeromicrobium sp.]|nr:hypothetical protein [Burkholderiales bacterium]